MSKLTTELDKLCALLDRDADVFCMRIKATQIGEMGKVKFIDEKILPQIRKQTTQQTESIIKYLENKDKNGKE